jgi:multidrug efflux pump subunit AcrA (membrane-fusion protein)
MVEELAQKKALVVQAERALAVAGARVATAAALVAEAEAGLSRAEANQKRWQIEKDRTASLSKRKVIDEQSEIETWNQYQSAAAALQEVKARVQSARAAATESDAARDKAEADIAVARADQARMAALLAYLQVRAPFDGVVTQRTIDLGHFVQPTAGVRGEPLFVVDAVDPVRVFVEVPEADAAWVQKAAAAQVRVPALQNLTRAGAVTRTAWSLNRTSRTLLAEIDLPNKDGQLRPGLYVSVSVSADRPNVWSLPTSAVQTQGDITQGYQHFCYRVEDGKARKTPIEIGTRAGERIQIVRIRVNGAAGHWSDPTGEEPIVGNAEGVEDGQTVNP